jgi:3-deoxy-manno-octulosonate cytidylyltransferase (CMP-KDO synthetase)
LNIAGIIPARFASSRFPGKPLAIIAGKTMIQRVYEQCIKARNLNFVVVATDDDSIYDEVIRFKGNVSKTSAQHANGTSRCAEVAEKYISDSTQTEQLDYVINIQGDEPLINPDQIDELAALFQNETISIATLVKKETDLSLLDNPTIVKAELDQQGFAVDFWRIQTDQAILDQIRSCGFFYRHVGIYGFKARLLLKLVKLAPTSNELTLHLEQMRWLDNGYKIKAGITSYESLSVDTPEDLEKAAQLIAAQLPA